MKKLSSLILFTIITANFLAPSVSLAEERPNIQSAIETSEVINKSGVSIKS